MSRKCCLERMKGSVQLGRNGERLTQRNLAVSQVRSDEDPISVLSERTKRKG